EAQGVGSLTVPRASEVFGTSPGIPAVDLTSNYEGGISKSHVFYRCYRTPEVLLMAAHALNMGLLREGGTVAGLHRPGGVEEGRLRGRGELRPGRRARPHPASARRTQAPGRYGPRAEGAGGPPARGRDLRQRGGGAGLDRPAGRGGPAEGAAPDGHH